MKHFAQNPTVSLWDEVQVRGTEKTGHRIAVGFSLFDPGELRARYLPLIKEAAERKTRKRGYGLSYELLIAVEDSWYEADRDLTEVKTFIEREILGLPLAFEA
jgi:hypothetical protein